MDDTVTTTATAAQLRTLLGVFMAEVMRHDTADTLRVLQREDLSLPRVAALNFVERQGAASISEISAFLNLSLANTSMIVDKLVCHDFATRVEDANDRRQKQVRLTPKGRALVQELRATRVDNVARRMLHLQPELLHRTIDVLRDLAAQLPEIDPERSATGQ